MPVYGLNCFSLMKYDTIVLSRSALERVEERLLTQMHRAGPMNKKYRLIFGKLTIKKRHLCSTGLGPKK